MKKLLPFIIMFLGLTGIALALTTTTFEEDPDVKGRIKASAMDVTGDWTGTFDGQQGSYYLDFRNLTNVSTLGSTTAGQLNVGTLAATSSAYLGSLTLGTKLANAQLANSSLTMTAGNGLTSSGCAPVALGDTCTFNVVGDSTLSVSADSMGLALTNQNNWTANINTTGSLMATGSVIVASTTVLGSFNTGTITATSGTSYLQTFSLGAAVSAATCALVTGGAGLCDGVDATGAGSLVNDWEQFTVNGLQLLSPTTTSMWIRHSSTTIEGALNLSTLTATSGTSYINALTLGTALADAQIASASTWNGKIDNTVTTLSSLVSIGTITTGTWNAGIITAPYIATTLGSTTHGQLNVGTLIATSTITAPNGITISCTDCITNANVSDTLTASDLVAGSEVVADTEVVNTITLDNITQITNRAISDTSGTLAIARGGTNQTSFGTRFISFDGTSLISSSSWSGANVSATGTLTVVGASTLTGLLTTNGGITGIGVNDFGGATSFETVNGGGPTVDTIGEIALDTTDNQLLVADSAGTARVFATAELPLFSVTIGSTTPGFLNSGFIEIPKWTKDGRDITQFRCHVVSGTSIVVNVSDNGTNDTETISCATTQTSDTDVATNSTFTADELWRIEFGTVTGTVDYLVFEAYGYISRE